MKTSRQRHGHIKSVDGSAPTSSSTLGVRRRWLLPVVASVLGVAALVSVAVARWNATELIRLNDELYRTTDTLQAVFDDHDLDFFEVETTIENALREYNDQAKPLNSTALEVLENGKRFFTRHVERDQTERETVATAYFYLGEIDRLLGPVSQSETAYRESRRLFQQLCNESPAPAIRMLLARTNISLGCLLALSGRAAEAEPLTSEAVADLEGLLATDPGDVVARGALSVAWRNLGLILALRGRDGTREIHRSIAQIRLITSQKPDVIRTAEFLVDTQQILSQLLWRQGRFDEAETACRQSIQGIDLERFQATAHRDQHRVHTLKYCEAIATAQFNLTRLQQRSEEHHPSADSWQWTPLVKLPERIIQADLLVHGDLPGEFENQEGMLMAWIDEEWYERTAAQVAAEIHRHVQLIILVEDELVEEHASHVLQTAGVAPDGVRFCHVTPDTAWTRDYGPMVIDTGDGTSQCVAPHRPLNSRDLRLKDAHVPLALSRVFKMPVLSAPILLEGGEVLTNGAGLCLVSTKLRETNRRAGYLESHVTNTIKRMFGATQVIYLEPLHGEPTGHVDWFASFTSSDTVVIGDYRGTDPVNQRLLDQHAEQLAGLTTPDGPLKVVRIPMPTVIGHQFSGTYTNVVFANGVLLVPSYAKIAPELEREAFDVLRRLLPGWKVVGIECTDLVARHGALHCAAANLYRGLPPSWVREVVEH